MKTKMNLLLLGSFLFLTSLSYSQNSKNLSDTIAVENLIFSSILNLRPVTLGKQNILISLQAEYPEYYKYFNSQSGKTERVPATSVLNEAYYYGRVVYGLTDRINLVALLPVASVHHYSPAGTKVGRGFGDMELGGIYSVLDSKKNPENNLTAGVTIGFPTGKYKNLGPNDYALGLGALKFKGDITGLHKIMKLNIIYSVYYEFRSTNSEDLNVGDEAGAYLTFQKQLNTNYGNFGIEGGVYGFWNFKDRKNGNNISHSDNYESNLYFGAWYNYLKDFYLRVGVPYTLYQNQSGLTKYEVLIQLDYQLNFRKNK